MPSGSPLNPLAILPAQNNTEGNVVQLQFTATTTDGSVPTYSAGNLPQGLSLNPGTGVITGTIAPGAARAGDDGLNGIFTTVLTATDGGFSEAESITWTVTPRIAVGLANANQSPVTAPKNVEGDAVNLKSLATTPDGTALTYSATNLPTGLTINQTTGAITGTVAAGAAVSGYNSHGSFVSTITATDGKYTGSRSIIWSVAPAISVIDSQQNIVSAPASAEGDAVNLQVKVNAPTNGPLTYTAANLPNGLTINASGAITGKIAAGAATGGVNGDGNYTAIITATDGTTTVSKTVSWGVISTIEQPGILHLTIALDAVKSESVTVDVDLAKIAPDIRTADQIVNRLLTQEGAALALQIQNFYAANGGTEAAYNPATFAALSQMVQTWLNNAAATSTTTASTGSGTTTASATWQFAITSVDRAVGDYSVTLLPSAAVYTAAVIAADPPATAAPPTVAQIKKWWDMINTPGMALIVGPAGIAWIELQIRINIGILEQHILQISAAVRPANTVIPADLLKHINALIAKLDSNNFREREAAYEALRELIKRNPGYAIGSVLESAMVGSGPNFRKMVEKLLNDTTIFKGTGDKDGLDLWKWELELIMAHSTPERAAQIYLAIMNNPGFTLALRRDVMLLWIRIFPQAILPSWFR